MRRAVRKKKGDIEERIASIKIKDEPPVDLVTYVNSQLRYHFGMSKAELMEMDDEEWVASYATLLHIRQQESKTKPGKR